MCCDLKAFQTVFAVFMFFWSHINQMDETVWKICLLDISKGVSAHQANNRELAVSQSCHITLCTVCVCVQY